MNAWLEKLNETFIVSGGYRYIIEGFQNTIIITLGALVIGVIIGSLIAIIKYFAEESPKLKPLAALCDLYTTVIRGIPITVLLLLFYFAILVSAAELTVAILAFGINSGAYMAELIRSGINAVDKGQMEAGRSLGMTRGQTMRKVIFPQAIRYILPAIGNEMIALLKRYNNMEMKLNFDDRSEFIYGGVMSLLSGDMNYLLPDDGEAEDDAL